MLKIRAPKLLRLGWDLIAKRQVCLNLFRDLWNNSLWVPKEQKKKKLACKLHKKINRVLNRLNFFVGSKPMLNKGRNNDLTSDLIQKNGNFCHSKTPFHHFIADSTYDILIPNSLTIYKSLVSRWWNLTGNLSCLYNYARPNNNKLKTYHKHVLLSLDKTMPDLKIISPKLSSWLKINFNTL